MHEVWELECARCKGKTQDMVLTVASPLIVPVLKSKQPYSTLVLVWVSC
jgi:hypothetical protein